MSVVTLDYNDLVADVDLSEQIEKVSLSTVLSLFCVLLACSLCYSPHGCVPTSIYI
jgi:hypothetical protein